MKVTGYIYDAKSGEPIAGTVQIIRLSDGRGLADAAVISHGYYSAWADGDTSDIGVRFMAYGYKAQDIPFDELSQGSDVFLQKTGTSSYLPYLLAVPVVLWALGAFKKRTGKVGALERGDVMVLFLLVGGVVAFDMIKKILEAIGLWDSKEEKDNDRAATDPGSFWNPNYWTTKPASSQYTRPITQSEAEHLAKVLESYINFWDDQEESIKGVFRSLPSQAAASFVAYQFQRLYGKDLFNYLRGGYYPFDGLSESDLSEITNFVKKLPAY